MAQRFADCAVLVTGASDGMGSECTALFHAEGAPVLAVARDPAKLSALTARNPGIDTLAQDLAEPDAPERIVDEAVRRMGGVDILVNCAGAFEMAAVTETSREHLQRMMEVNFYAPSMLSVRAIPFLKRSGRGRIINISSIATHYTDSAMGPYTASKRALEGFTMNLALELGAFGITANLIAPGMVRTGMTQAMLEDSAVSKHFTSRVPVGRVGHVNDIATAVAYLADASSGFCNGTTIRLDGGYTVGAYGSDWSS